NRHQTFPYVGAAAPARLQRRDAEILKWELGLNIVRTSHYPQSPHFLDRCDEIGLLVFEEIPGWVHIGGAPWKKVTYNDVRQMVVRDRNHPSVVLWGVRINESRDDHDFYTETNRIAHELDPTRQTGGVRYFEGSELLEDVYTMNDFTHSGGAATVRDPRQVTRLDRDVPYLVTEFNGHMYPTKSFDQEERLVEHALRHARVQNAIAGNKGIAGGIGWCAFDYNTHYDFGSGDRICYHGVSDIFRFPKFAAHFYESQIDPGVRPVLHVASLWKLGERSGGAVVPLIVFSNCNRIVIHVGRMKLGTFRPAREQFPHLPHPPFICSGTRPVWREDWRELRVVGLLRGKPAVEQRIAPDGVPEQFICWADDTALVADGADMTRLAFCAADRYGNVLPYAGGAVTITASGPATIVGENPFCLVGGVGAVYLRAGRRPGTVKLKLETPRLPAQSVTVRVRRH
ncbi:MAG: glycoside hydrolase family 2 TIM barrel-domain containing protein, partial [Planctomycetota bacterium]